jgi:O-antigen/teichoic acid export membrane protein
MEFGSSVARGRSVNRPKLGTPPDRYSIPIPPERGEVNTAGGGAAARTRAQKRTRAVVIGTASMLTSRVVTFASSFLTIAIVSRALRPEAFGLWTVLSTLAFFGSSFDFGLGQGMRNRLSALAARESRDREAERRLFFAVLFSVIGLSSVLLLGLLLSSPLIPWVGVLHAERSSLVAQIPVIATAVAGLFVVSMTLNLGGVGFLAYQEAGIRSAFDVLQSALTLLAAAVLASRASLTVFVIAFYVALDVALLAALVFFLKRRRWNWLWLRPRAIASEVRSILSSSLSFWLLGVSYLLVFSMDPIIAARVLGLSGAGEFSVVQRLFILLITVHFTVLTPLWSAYSHAAETGDWPWIESALKRSLAITVGFVALGGSVLLVSAPTILGLWIGKSLEDRGFLVTLALWAGMYAILNCYSVLLNGLSKMRWQNFFLASAALLNWPVSLWLGHRYGASGIVGGTIVVLLPLLLSNGIQVHYTLRRNRFVCKA